MKAIPITQKARHNIGEGVADVISHVRDREGKEWVLIPHHKPGASSILPGDTILYQHPDFKQLRGLNCRWWLVNYHNADYKIIQTESNEGALVLLNKDDTLLGGVTCTSSH